MTSRIGNYQLQRYLRHGTMPQLAAFYAVVRLGSVTRAAELLCVAQPTVSGHLRKLSESLGIELFAPKGKHLEPTAAGRSLLGTVQDVFDAFEQCEERLLALREPFVGGGGVRASHQGQSGFLRDL